MGKQKPKNRLQKSQRNFRRKESSRDYLHQNMSQEGEEASLVSLKCGTENAVLHVLVEPN